jgi:uncharacterized membrane protein YkvA (DUF1232 family)
MFFAALIKKSENAEVLIIKMKNYLEKSRFERFFTEESLWKKISKFSKVAGIKVVYAALLLYYIMTDRLVGVKTKLSIAAALGYFILPTDAIFDLTPLIGYSDDLGVMIFVLTQVASNITPEIKEKARVRLAGWFGRINESELQELENNVI